VDLTPDNASGAAAEFEFRKAMTLLRRLFKSHAKSLRLAPDDKAGMNDVAMTDRQLEFVWNSERDLELEARASGREIENNTVGCCGAAAEDDRRRHAHSEAVMISSIVQDVLLHC
jgi:hypothetical protein